MTNIDICEHFFYKYSKKQQHWNNRETDFAFLSG